MNEVYVIGGNHHNTLGVVRALGEKGLRPILILVTTENKPFVSYSQYIKKTIQIPQNDLIPDVLLEESKARTSKHVVICCSDASSGVVDINRDALSSFFFLPGSEFQGRITSLMSKRKMADIAQSIGLKTPETCYGENCGLFINYAPLIIKPLISMKGSKSDIHICYSYDEVKKYTDELGAENVQIQQFIDKDFEYQLIGCSTSKEVIIPGVSKILRPCKGSNTSFLHYTPIEEGFCEIEKCKEFVRRTGYHGLFSLEFLRAKSGQDFFMEINFRNDGNAICVTEAGMNLPFIWYLDCIGKDYTEETNKEIIPVYVMPDMAELKLLVTRQISLREYVGDFKKTNRFMEYDKKDPKPFWRLIRRELHLW